MGRIIFALGGVEHECENRPLPFVVCFGPFVDRALSRMGQAKSEGKAPVIVNAYAVDNGQYGTIWKIYIEAEDPDGDMLRIASVVTQTGYGYYPTNWTYIKSADQKHFKGYLQWNTFSSKAVACRNGLRSLYMCPSLIRQATKAIQWFFPFSFETSVSTKAVAVPFDQGELPRLGYIHLDLINPFTASVRN